ncbi:ComEC/Rec2 family competence protein [Pedobacter alpinus]|uniref:ComEC/Rec2 family competence protein n=1 Tax=Pedobacter alpinus TaxID=1590643 RepID=A0ABW5TVG8_9SPHI
MIAYFKTEVPFLRLVLIFIVGVALSITQNLAPNLWYNYIWFGCIISLLITALTYKYFKLYLKRHYTGLLVYITMFISGIVLCNQHKEIYKPNHFSKLQAQQLIGVVNEAPKIKGDVARFTLNIKNNVHNYKITPSTGKLLIALRFDTTKTLNLSYGDLIILKSKYQITEPAYNPSEFNYRRYLSFQNIYHQTFINQRQISKIGINEGNPIIAFALDFREKQVLKFNQFLENANAKAVASTLILGYRAQLDKELLTTYSNTGTMHVLSVSGMHVAIVVMLLSYLLGFLDKQQKTKILKTIIIIFLVWFYALITGLAPSVCRAALMITFVLVAKARSSSVNIFNVLAISAFILLLYNPYNLVNVGFQLSYVAVGGLIYLYPKVHSIYQTQNKIIGFIWSTMAVSIAAQIATAPISLFYFHQFPVYFILSNVFIVIPAVLIMYVGIAFLLSWFYLPAIKFLGFILNKLIIFTNDGLHFIENIPHANITQVWLNSFEIILFYLLLASITFTVANIKYLKYCYAFITLIVFSLTVKQFKHMNQKNATFFSLRKNTAIALIEGRNAVLITDLDKEEFTYTFSVKPYLDSCNVNNIEFINPHLSSDEKIINFNNKSLKIINHQTNFYSKSKQDWLLLSSNKVINLDKVLTKNKFETLLIDGRNRDFVIKALKLQAQNLKIKTHTLKREFALEYKL